MSITGFAAKSERTNIEIIDGMSKKKHQLKNVNLMVGGKDVFADVPAVLYNDRTLVPIRVVAENLGASIEWNENTYEAKIVMGEKTIILKVDSSTATVNGVKKKLPDGVPAKLLGYQGNYRTMVPIRFVSEELGMTVNWIAETLTATVDAPGQAVTAIEYKRAGETPRIHIKTTGAVEYTTMFLEGSKYGSNDRLVLDIANVTLNIKDASIVNSDGLVRKDINMDGIKSIRGSLFETNPRNVSRIVVDMERQKGYNVYFDKASSEIIVEFSNSVKNIKMEKKGNEDVVVIQTEETPIYNVMDLGNRVVVDVLNAKLKFSQSQVNVSRGGISRIRTSAFSPDANYNQEEKIVRVVLDLDPGQTAENLFVEAEGKDILVYLKGNSLKGIDYTKTGKNQSQLQLSLFEADQYYVSYDEYSKNLNIKVLKDKMDLKTSQVEIADGLVQAIKVNDSIEDNYYSIDVLLAPEAQYRIENSDSLTEEIKILISRTYTSDMIKYGNSIVVVDAGHGGHDPGATSGILKLKEKDLALDTANRLAKLLEEAGFTTIMTRTEDLYPGLQERAYLANELGADAFVSVHYNAHGDPAIDGVQVLFCPDSVRDNKNFAKIVQEEMLKELNATDRKIVERPNLAVLNKTNMPAVLAEVAFLSNAREEQLASTEEYRQKAAQALFNGIKRYFDEVILK